MVLSNVAVLALLLLLDVSETTYKAGKTQDVIFPLFKNTSIV